MALFRWREVERIRQGEGGAVAQSESRRKLQAWLLFYSPLYRLELRFKIVFFGLSCRSAFYTWFVYCRTLLLLKKWAFKKSMLVLKAPYTATPPPTSWQYQLSSIFRTSHDGTISHPKSDETYEQAWKALELSRESNLFLVNMSLSPKPILMASSNVRYQNCYISLLIWVKILLNLISM